MTSLLNYFSAHNKTALNDVQQQEWPVNNNSESVLKPMGKGCGSKPPWMKEDREMGAGVRAEKPPISVSPVIQREDWGVDLECNLSPLHIFYIESRKWKHWQRDEVTNKRKQQWKKNNTWFAEWHNSNAVSVQQQQQRRREEGYQSATREKKTLGRSERRGDDNGRFWRSPQSRLEWRPFSPSAETRPKKSNAQWTQANEGSHCLQLALKQTIRSIIVPPVLYSTLFPSVPSPQHHLFQLC